MSEWINEGSSDNFQQQVIDRSFHVPVVVDFWAPWCQPCKMLAPTLEAAVNERNGQVELVKIDTDQNATLGQQFGIRGIPAVKIFVDGQVREEFVGVVDRHAVDVVLDRCIPSEADQAMKLAEQALAAGRNSEVPILLDGVANNPQIQDRALLLIAEAYVRDHQLEHALRALQSVDPNSPEAGKAQGIETRLLLMQAADALDRSQCTSRIERNGRDHEARWALAGHHLAAGEHGAALEELMQLLQDNRAFHNDGARKAMLGIFEQLGPEASLAHDYRRRMQIYL